LGYAAPTGPQNYPVFSSRSKTVLSILEAFDILFLNTISYLETSIETDNEFNVFHLPLRFKVGVEILGR